ncbi:MAG TPA: type II toxin-antitoxin system PemK/MazF family toxin [Pirellulaceae bacterium]|jgi:mRNA interferase MazF
MTYAPGDILLVDFPLVSGTTSILRPALVIIDSGDNDVVLARITTQQHSSTFDLAITDWKGAGLRAASFLRLHKLATSEKSCIHKQLGKLQQVDHVRVSNILRASFSNW